MNSTLIAKQNQGLLSYFNGYKAIFIIAIIALLAACSSKPTKEALQQSEEAYFKNAQKAIKTGNYLLAIDQLLALESRFPFGRYAAQAQLDLIYAYYQSLEYDQARAVARRFIRLYPNHHDLDYAQYMEALAAYDIDRGFLSRVLPTSPAERDLYPLYDTFTLLKRFVLEYPDSNYYEDARQRMIYVRNLLAEHEIQVGKFYLRRSAYLAAVKRGQYVVEHFPNTPSVEQGLELMLQGYNALGLKDLEGTTQAILKLNFPNSSALTNNHSALDSGEAKNLQELQKVQAHEDRSWLNRLTFGWLDAEDS